MLKLSEEAICNDGGDGCLFTWLTPKHEITAIDMSVDAAGAQIITLTSDGAELFTTDTAE